MDMLSLFSKLKLSVPTTAAEVPPLADTVKTMKEKYEEKQKRALEAGEDGVEEEADSAAATPTAAARGGAAGGSGAAPASLSRAAAAGGAGSAVAVNVRCDEAFGTVLVEIKAH